NVHPAKTEVRFLHEATILAFVRDGVALALRSTEPTTQFPRTYADLPRADERIRTDVPRWHDTSRTWQQRPLATTEPFRANQTPVNNPNPPGSVSMPYSSGEEVSISNYSKANNEQEIAEESSVNLLEKTAKTTSSNPFLENNEIVKSQEIY